MLFKLLYLLVCLAFYGQIASAKEINLIKAVPDAQLVGQGQLSVLFWDIYDAELYAPQGTWSYDRPFLLSIRYLSAFSGLDIADRAVQEIRMQGFRDESTLLLWHNKMKAIFPDVKNGTVLSALFLPAQQHTEFFLNNQSIGLIPGDAFLRWFAGIWLSEKTSEPELRKHLLGYGTNP